MRDVLYLWRFFRVVPPVPPLLSATFLVLTAVSAAAVIVEPAGGPAALAPVLLLQLFAASSGFAVPARRGHYDLLLTRGGNRLHVALAHWVMSIAPGVASWLAIATVEQIVSRGTRGSLLTSGTWAAIFLVSTLPWALTVALPRFAGGIGWLLVLVTAGMTFPTGVFGEWATASTPADALARPAWIFLLYPVAAVGQHLAPAQMLAAAPALALAAGALAVACRWAAHADVPLEASQ